jgi:hypothetical protein
MRAHIFIDAESARLRSFGSSSRGSTNIVKLELEVSDPYRLGDLLAQLGKFRQDQAAPVKPATRRRQTPQQLLLAPPETDR